MPEYIYYGTHLLFGFSCQAVLRLVVTVYVLHNITQSIHK